jgi:aminoglycoside phosphotransferase (APT) family kinase protein
MATSGGRRDRDALVDGLDRWLATDPLPDAGGTVADLVHPSAGLSNETVIVTLSSKARIVVRLPPAVASFPDHDFLLQARVMDLAGSAGIAVPAPVVAEVDESYVGSPFLVMPFVDGDIPGPASVFDRWLTRASLDDQRRAQTAMIDTLAAIGKVEWAGSPAASDLRGATDGATLADEVEWWRRFLDWASDGAPLPRFAAMLDWCATTCPTHTAPPSLTWGDPRLENLIFDQDREVVAVLDWELATVGPAEMDLGWYLGLERVLREMTGGSIVPGFRDDPDLVAEYATALGRPVEHVEWHLIFAVARSICINVRQAAISAAAGVDYLLPGDETNPLLAVVEGWIAAF